MTAGTKNGTSIFVAIEDSPGAGTYTQVGGQTTHTLTLNNNPIDITTKDDNSFRTLMDAEGLQSADLTLELTFNSDTAYAQLRALAGTKAITKFRIAIGAANFDANYMIGSWAETAPDNDKLTNSVSLVSSGTFAWV